MKIPAIFMPILPILALPVVVGCASANAAEMPATPNAALMDRYFQIVDSKHPEGLSEVEGPGLSYTLPLGKMDPATHNQVLASFAVAFPNYKHTITRCVEAAELVACEGVFTGDHMGPLAMPDGSSLPPTQKHVEFPVVAFGRVEHGKFVEYNGYFDVLAFLAQLGVGPGAPKNP